MITSNSHRETWKLNFYWPAVTVSYHPVVECTEYSPAQKEEEMFAHVDQTVRDVVSDADDVETEHRLFLPILPSPLLQFRVSLPHNQNIHIFYSFDILSDGQKLSPSRPLYLLEARTWK